MLIIFTKRLIRIIARILAVVAVLFALQNAKWVLKKIYPNHYEDLIKVYAEEYHVDPYLVVAIMRNESKFNPNAVSSKEAKGLMQIAPITGKWAAEKLPIENYREEMLFDPELNIQIGCWYLSVLQQEFNYDFDLIIPAYNAGNGNVKKWLKNTKYSKDGKSLDEIPFEETKIYHKKVSRDYKIYKWLYSE